MRVREIEREREREKLCGAWGKRQACFPGSGDGGKNKQRSVGGISQISIFLSFFLFSITRPCPTIIITLAAGCSLRETRQEFLVVTQSFSDACVYRQNNGGTRTHFRNNIIAFFRDPARVLHDERRIIVFFSFDVLRYRLVHSVSFEAKIKKGKKELAHRRN